MLNRPCMLLKCSALFLDHFNFFHRTAQSFPHTVQFLYRTVQLLTFVLQLLIDRTVTLVHKKALFFRTLGSRKVTRVMSPASRMGGNLLRWVKWKRRKRKSVRSLVSDWLDSCRWLNSCVVEKLHRCQRITRRGRVIAISCCGWRKSRRRQRWCMLNDWLKCWIRWLLALGFSHYVVGLIETKFVSGPLVRTLRTTHDCLVWWVNKKGSWRLAGCLRRFGNESWRFGDSVWRFAERKLGQTLFLSKKVHFLFGIMVANYDICAGHTCRVWPMTKGH